MVFPTNLCTASSGRRFLILHTYTATYVYTQLQTYLHRCMHTSTASGAWTCIYINMNIGIQVCTLVRGITRDLLAAWDVILGHVATQFEPRLSGPCERVNPGSTWFWCACESESFTYTCMAIQTTLKPMLVSDGHSENCHMTTVVMLPLPFPVKGTMPIQ